jgi:L-asparaginase
MVADNTGPTTPPIMVITTGGTIDKSYFDALSQYQVGPSIVAELLTNARVDQPYEIVEVLRKDSLELTDADRAGLVSRITELKSDRIVITHGTDTMVESARVLAVIVNKTIVLTGALSPARFAETDAPFNLGMAFAAVQVLPVGVYIAMSGRIFRGDQVRKDREAARFVAIG